MRSWCGSGGGREVLGRELRPAPPPRNPWTTSLEFGDGMWLCQGQGKWGKGGGFKLRQKIPSRDSWTHFHTQSMGSGFWVLEPGSLREAGLYWSLDSAGAGDL